jgi:hypothetical protein
MYAIAFGWRLEHLEVKSRFIHWIGVLTPELAPGKMVDDLRQHLSTDIFTDFPRYRLENPSGDFWAPGNLIVTCRQALADPILEKYLENTRNKQGIGKKLLNDSE